MKKFALIALTFIIGLIANAQTTTYSGTVTDATTGEPIPGANVFIRASLRGSTTGMDGKFQIEGSAGDTLEISFISYEAQKILLGANTSLAVALPQDMKLLNEAVVIGYGSQKKKDITGAISIVDSEEFKDRPNTQVSSLIQGKAAGVQVLNNSGKPNAGLNIRVRGTTSIASGTDPLYVIDGVPTNDTRSLNPADIETISVLKDASSAAIYGAQGANGVVLITTKRGTSLTPQFNFSTYYGFAEVWNTIDVLNREQYRDLMTELGYNTDWSRYQADTDWQNEIFSPATSQNYQLSVSGKTDKTSYYLSGGYVQQEGVVRTSEMERFSAKVNLQQELKDWLQVGTNITYTDYRDVDVPDNAAVNQGGIILGVLTTPPNIGVFNDSLGMYTSNPFQNWENPFASTDGTIRSYRNQRLLGNAFLEAEPIAGLKIRSNFGIDYSSASNNSFLDPFLTSFGQAQQGRASYGTNLNNYFIFDQTVAYEKTFDKHMISVLGGFVAQRFKNESSFLETRNFASSSIITPNAGAEFLAATGRRDEKANSSFISRINYDYEGRYLFTANFRADGSSVFGPDKKWGYFPSFSAGWRISEEKFMQDVNKLSELKLRFGWGVVGNDQIGFYSHFGQVRPGANYPIGGSAQPGTFPASIENRDLKWEESEQVNLGIDISFFRGRVALSIDGYIKTTTDLLLNAPLPLTTGFSSAIQNIGEVQNRGLEFLLNTVNYTRDDFQWSTNFNLSINRNEVVNIAGDEIPAGTIAGQDISLVREGEALGIFYGYVVGGVDPESGDQFYIDRNGESTFDPVADDRRIIGDPNPDFLYGFTNDFAYKGFSLSIFIQGSQGNDIYSATRMETESMNSPKNQSAAVLDRWRSPGDITDVPRAEFGTIPLVSTRFVEDGSYLRFKAVTFGYTIPKTILNKVGIENLKLYVTGENLFTFTDYSGFDPEVNAFGGDNLAQGIDFGTYPQTRNLIFGLNLTF